MKEEPAEDVAATVKKEPLDAEEDDMGEGADISLQMDALLDVRIKEEATDEQSELYYFLLCFLVCASFFICG